MTPTEERMYTHLSCLVSTLVLIERSHAAGHTDISLPNHLRAARLYMLRHCPALLRSVEAVYRGEDIPDMLATQARDELTRGR